MIVPTLRVGMPQWTLCVRFGTRSGPGCIPTQSVGTIRQSAISLESFRSRSALPPLPPALNGLTWLPRFR
ncbi:hypothetical protein C1X57_07930 [Pseudomonas sp. FW215-E1]|nr:hypothetical protein C1X57_07930 [Pseudomonas sp. FW215-E1]